MGGWFATLRKRWVTCIGRGKWFFSQTSVVSDMAGTDPRVEARKRGGMAYCEKYEVGTTMGLWTKRQQYDERAM